ncbi:MAG: MopE-related protein [Acidobacteriota bacterium]
MKKGIVLLVIATVLMVSGYAVRNVGAYGSYGSNVNTFCTSDPYTGDCLLCHTASSKADPTVAKTAYLSNSICYFCPDDAQCGPACTDADGDGYSINGGSCGQVDCNDDNSSVNPGAVEDCVNGIDDDCDGLLDALDTNAVNCPVVCIDADGDGYATNGGICGPKDCNDANPAVNPAATEICNDGIDNDCDGLLDGLDPDCGACIPTMQHERGKKCSDGIDNDCDGLTDGLDPDCSARGGIMEICNDGIDNDGDGKVDCADKKDCGKDPACQ